MVDLTAAIRHVLRERGGEASLDAIVSDANRIGARASRYQVQRACEDLVDRGEIEVVHEDVTVERDGTDRPRHRRDQTVVYALE